MNEILLFLGGIVALVVGAELLVRGASKLALSFGISPLVVGLTVVAFGTSAPETTVSVSAVLSGQTDIAVGNVVGSNIFNVLFILGIAALIVPLRVDAQVIRQEVPMMIAASALLLLFVLDQQVSLFESVFLFVLLIGYTIFWSFNHGANLRWCNRSMPPRSNPRSSPLGTPSCRCKLRSC